MICMICDFCGVMSEFTREEDGTAHEPKSEFLLGYIKDKWLDACSVECAEQQMRLWGVSEEDITEHLRATRAVALSESVPEKSRKTS